MQNALFFFFFIDGNALTTKWNINTLQLGEIKNNIEREREILDVASGLHSLFFPLPHSCEGLASPPYLLSNALNFGLLFTLRYCVYIQLNGNPFIIRAYVLYIRNLVYMSCFVVSIRDKELKIPPLTSLLISFGSILRL